MPGVAGLKVPAFVEHTSRASQRQPSWLVSPGLKSRPSLSNSPPIRQHALAQSVAGLKIPAFVEQTAQVSASTAFG